MPLTAESGSYAGAGYLLSTLNTSGNVTNYGRWLDLDEALARTSWTQNHIDITQFALYCTYLLLTLTYLQNNILLLSDESLRSTYRQSKRSSSVDNVRICYEPRDSISSAQHYLQIPEHSARQRTCHIKSRDGLCIPLPVVLFESRCPDYLYPIPSRLRGTLQRDLANIFPNQ